MGLRELYHGVTPPAPTKLANRVKVKLVLCDDDGNVLPDAAEQVHSLGQTRTVNEIEQAIEEWRRQALPQLERITGQRVLSDQRIWQAVMEKAAAGSQTLANEARQSLEATGDRPLVVASESDIYAPDQPEILVFDDGIQVKRQKSERVSPEAAPPEQPQESQTPPRKRVNTDVVLLQTAAGGFEYAIAPMQADGRPLLPLETIIKATVSREHGSGSYESVSSGKPCLGHYESSRTQWAVVAALVWG